MVSSDSVVERRRCLASWRAQQLWDAILGVRSQKQIPAITRMARYMNRCYKVTKEETQQLLDMAVEDNLVKLETKIGTKGSKSGIQEKAYRLPTPDMLPRERSDWYCFLCHAPGEVKTCAQCPLVFHLQCLNSKQKEQWEQTQWFCSLCTATMHLPDVFERTERRDLNQLLRVVVRRMRSNFAPDVDLYARHMSSLHHVCTASNSKVNESNKSNGNNENKKDSESPSIQQKSAKEEDQGWRNNFLIKQPMDFALLESRCGSNEYRSVADFRVDCQLLAHNIIVFQGVLSDLSTAASKMLPTAESDLEILETCRDCFRYKVVNEDRHWFCKPCRPFHKLVYAKQKGSAAFWPAKVVGEDDGKSLNVEVRFFGGSHKQTTIERVHTKPIDTSISALQVKRSSLWNKACEELKRYQEIVDKVKATKFLETQYGDPMANLNIELPEFPDEDDDQDEGEIENQNDHNSKDSEKKQDEPKNNSTVRQQTPSLSRPKRSKKDESEQVVSSSSQESRYVNVAVQTKPANKSTATSTKKDKQFKNKGVQGSIDILESQEVKDLLKKMRADFDQEKKRAIIVATRSLERDLERMRADHATELEDIEEKHEKQVSETKHKQWCFHCEAEAIYWCCWNTAYCSIECQQKHWHKEHKRCCRRKR